MYYAYCTIKKKSESTQQDYYGLNMVPYYTVTALVPTQK